MKERTGKRWLGGVLLTCVVCGVHAQTEQGLWFSSTSDRIWQMQEVEWGEDVIGRPEFVIDVADGTHTFKGWGTCFNELGWDALNLLPEDVQQEVMRRMFDPKGELRFTIGRIPVGASDYARGWYSCNETDGDFEMAHFTIDRDKEAVIPYIKFAQRYNPDMTFAWDTPPRPAAERPAGIAPPASRSAIWVMMRRR